MIRPTYSPSSTRDCKACGHACEHYQVFVFEERLRSEYHICTLPGCSCAESERYRADLEVYADWLEQRACGAEQEARMKARRSSAFIDAECIVCAEERCYCAERWDFLSLLEFAKQRIATLTATNAKQAERIGQ